MKTFYHEVIDCPYTEKDYSPEFDFSAMCNPKKIEATLQVTKLEMGMSDGSALVVIFERSIDGKTWFNSSKTFNAVNIDNNGEISLELQQLMINDEEVIGNRVRFRYEVSQANQGSGAIPSKASFKVAILIK